MTVQEKKKYLKRYNGIILQIDSIDESIRELRENETKPSVQISTRGSGSNAKNDLSSYAGRLDELERRKIPLAEEAAEIEEIIKSVEEKENGYIKVAILRYGFINNLRDSKIAEKTGYSTETIRKIRRKALEEVEIS